MLEDAPRNAMAFLSPDFDYDIFISFSHRDNAVPLGQRPEDGGWVERFARNLENWLRDQRRLDGPRVWLDKRRLSGATEIDERIRTDLARTGILLVLHSRNHRDSDYCRQELNWFLDAVKGQPAGLSPGGERRLFNVVINKLPHQAWPEGSHWTQPLAGPLGFPFHSAPADDRRPMATRCSRPTRPTSMPWVPSWMPPTGC